VRVPPAIEEDQVACLGPDHRTVSLDRLDIGSVRVVGEHKLAARAGRMICAEQQASQRVGVDVTLQPHRGTTLDVEHDAGPVVACGYDGFIRDFLR
jgi:hypothetical protein